MKKVPESVLTRTKKGKILIRNLVARGEFVCYDYRDPSTFEKRENGKIRIFLKDKNGKTLSYFLIPLKDGRFLAIKADASSDKIIWNDSEKRAESLWEGEK